MRQLWLAAAILVAILALAGGHAAQLDHLLTPMEHQVQTGIQAARNGDWAKAEAIARDLQTTWQRNSRTLRCLHSHTDINQITVLLEQSRLWCQARAPEEYSLTGLHLQNAMEDLKELESFSLQNLL